MKITLLVVGKTTNNALDSLIADYQKRLTHYVPFSLVVLPELKNAKSLSFEQQKQSEGEMILKTVGTSAYVVLLDEHGKEYTSVGFSEMLQRHMNAGTRVLAFVVGGAYGF